MIRIAKNVKTLVIGGTRFGESGQALTQLDIIELKYRVPKLYNSPSGLVSISCMENSVLLEEKI